MTTPAHDCRAEFEKWAIKTGYSLEEDGFGFKDSATSIALNAWQAAWNAKPTEPAGDDKWRMPDGRKIFGEGSPHDIGEHLAEVCASGISVSMITDEYKRAGFTVEMDAYALIALNIMRPYLRQPVQAAGQVDKYGVSWETFGMSGGTPVGDLMEAVAFYNEKVAKGMKASIYRIKTTPVQASRQIMVADSMPPTANEQGLEGELRLGVPQPPTHQPVELCDGMLPCPHCEGEPRQSSSLSVAGDLQGYVYCNSCGAQTSAQTFRDRSQYSPEEMVEHYKYIVNEAVKKWNARPTMREYVAPQPTETMCDRARGFIIGLEMNRRTWKLMQDHLDTGGYETLYYIRDRAMRDPKGHITRWDIAHCIYLLMAANEIEDREGK